jgi:hypothetical protein
LPGTLSKILVDSQRAALAEAAAPDLAAAGEVM